MTLHGSEWSVIKEKKIQATDIKFFGSTEAKTRRDRITNKTFKEVGIQHLLRKLEEKQL
jgi:hypothetical protein